MKWKLYALIGRRYRAAGNTLTGNSILDFPLKRRPGEVRPFLCTLVAAGLVWALPAAAAPLVVHEWGTFTSLQDEAGRTVPGINSDDEPVPRFCHDLHQLLILRPDSAPPLLSKGIARCRPDVTMRLETPVIYFHPAPGASLPSKLSVKVGFHGGWLTQFYPQAEPGGCAFDKPLAGDTFGSLAWNDLSIGGAGEGPATSDRVWTAPRAVDAASVTTTNHESERFLFYRGVGHLQCPLTVSRNSATGMLEVRADAGVDALQAPLPIPRLWLASFRGDGICALRELPAVNLESRRRIRAGDPLLTTPAAFTESEYSMQNIPALRAGMKQALIHDGLFGDEAEALLNTWEVSYFNSPGLRLFFMVPRAWTDRVLPLDVSVPCETRRVMVGRLELVTPEQRERLRALAAAPVPVKSWGETVRPGAAPFSGEMPAAYRELGRFRNALLLDEQRNHPARSLDAFIRLNGLQALAGN